MSRTGWRTSELWALLSAWPAVGYTLVALKDTAPLLLMMSIVAAYGGSRWKLKDTEQKADNRAPTVAEVVE